VRENRRSLTGQRAGLLAPVGGHDPLDFARSKALRPFEQIRLGQFSRDVPLHGGKREPNDLSDRREVVIGEIGQKREKVARNGGFIVDRARERTDWARALTRTNGEHHPDEAASPKGTDYPSPGHGLRGQMRGYRVREGVRDGHGESHVREKHWRRPFENALSDRRAPR